jgi:hypothetical protein
MFPTPAGWVVGLAVTSFTIFDSSRRRLPMREPFEVPEPSFTSDVRTTHTYGGNRMGRGLLLWLIGIPIPIILLIWLFGGLH